MLRLVAFLSNIVSIEGVEVDSRKTKVFKNCPRPFNPTNIRSFLGLANYYRRFVERFSSITSTLTTFTPKKLKFEWSEPCEDSFHLLKDRLTFSPVLIVQEGTNMFVVYYDASRWVDCDVMQHSNVIVHAYG